MDRFYPFAGMSVHRYGPLQNGTSAGEPEGSFPRTTRVGSIVEIVDRRVRSYWNSRVMGDLGGRSLHPGFNLCTVIIITTLLSNVEISRSLEFL